MQTDVEIAQAATLKPIGEIASGLGLQESDYEPYGHDKAKISLDVLKRLQDAPDGKLILCTGINPTAAGEGKTTTNVGLSMALNRIGHKAMTTLREPSLGPCFGMKGGAAGGGFAQVVPMDDINLHFTGDFHAITSAHNLLSALLDNSIHQGNPLNINPKRIVWKRVLDMNDRALRNIVVGMGKVGDGVVRESGFEITVASEIMAALCLATGLEDLKERFGRIIVAYTYDKAPVTAAQLEAPGAMALLMKDAVKPNLVQTLENTPAIIHGGPFANIAHGNNSVVATQTALKLADYVVTEAGFGADLGAEKFFDIVCPAGGLQPDAVVVVATVRALKLNGGRDKKQLAEEDLDALGAGLVNLEQHLENVQKFGVPAVVAINRFPSDTDAELDLVRERCAQLGADVALSEVDGTDPLFEAPEPERRGEFAQLLKGADISPGWIDGFLMAVVIAPKVINPDRWMSEILNAAVAALHPEMVERFLEVVMMRTHTTIDQSQDRVSFTSAMSKRGKKAKRDWAAGFSHGYDTFRSGWPAKSTGADDRAMIKFISGKAKAEFSPEDIGTLALWIEARGLRTHSRR